MKNIYLANPRGFCAGVKYAVGTVEQVLASGESRSVYILKEIVHNAYIVSQFNRRGAISVNDIDMVPDGSVLILSAHGSPPEHYQRAHEKNLHIIDATCPLVRKVHQEALRFARDGYHIVYIGHRHHDEAEGVLAECPEQITLIETADEARSIALPQTTKLAYLTQTTLNVQDTRQIIGILEGRFPDIQAPQKEDICYATTNRQRAVIELADMCDIVIILGSQNSSNSQRLRECVHSRQKLAYLIDDKDHLDPAWLEHQNIGITAGASAPEILVQDLVERIQQIIPSTDLLISEVQVCSESMFFPVQR